MKKHGSGILPALVVVPAHLPRHWSEKLAEFAPELRVHTIAKVQPYELLRKGRQKDLWPDRLPDVLICSYHKLRGWAETLAGLARLVVFEECQQLRNPGSDRMTWGECPVCKAKHGEPCNPAVGIPPSRKESTEMALRKKHRDGNPRRYTFKMYPTKEQHDALLRQCSMVANLWNAFLELQEQQYRRVRGQRGVTHDASRKAHLSHFDMTAMVKPLRAEEPDWAQASVWTAHRVAYAVSKAFEGFFRRAKSGAGASSGYPRYKSFHRGDHNWIPHRFASGCRLKHVGGNNWSLELKGIEGPIHCRGKLPAIPKAMTDADIRYLAGIWWLSVAADMENRIQSALEGVTHVRLDCLDCFAEVDGRKVYAFEIGVFEDARIEQISRRMSELERSSGEYAALRRRKARLQSHEARRRREKLHEWTTALVRNASVIDLTLPADVAVDTKSGRGNERQHGAAVETKAMFNRLVLSMAPSMAAQMIRYKAKEAGVELIERKSRHLEVGNLLVEAKKASRRVQSSLRRGFQ